MKKNEEKLMREKLQEKQEIMKNKIEIRHILIISCFGWIAH